MSETSQEPANPPPPSEDPSLLGLFSTTDHKRIGRMFITLAVLFGVSAVVLEVLLRIDLTDANGYVLFDSETFTQSFLLVRELVIFGFIVPLFLGIAIYVVPMQIGASGLVFPRAALSSFWTWFISMVILVGAYLGNGGPFGGNSDSVDLYLIGLGFGAAALLVGVVTVVTTALTVRAPALSLSSVSAFTWSTVVWGVGLLMTLPILLANLIFVYVDHRYGRLFLGGNHGVWDQIDWVYRAPQLFLYVVPALGLVVEVLLSSAKRRALLPQVVAMGIGMLGLFGLGAWAQLNVQEGLDVTNGWPGVVYFGVFVGALLSILAVVAITFATLGSSKNFPELSTPVLASVAMAALLVVAGLQTSAGAFLDWAESLDWFTIDPVLALRDTTWGSAQFQLLAIGIGVLALIGSLSWWAPKIWGRSLHGSVGRISVALAFVGSFVAALGTSLAGLLTGQPELPRFDGDIDPLRGGVYDFIGDPSSALNVVALVGVAMVGTAALIFASDLFVSVVGRKGASVDADPWDSDSPEWLLASPPPLGPLTDLPDLVPNEQALDVNAQELEEATS